MTLDITETLNGLPEQSQFEFNTFILEAHPTPARRLRHILAMAEELNARESDILTEIASGCLKSGALTVANRSLTNIRDDLQKCKSYVDSFSQIEIGHMLASYQTEEADYWATVLGRRGGIELITQGRISSVTMDKMAMLPHEAFTKSIVICNRYARMVQQITEQVEDDMTTGKISGMPTVNR